MNRWEDGIKLPIIGEKVIYLSLFFVFLESISLTLRTGTPAYL
ncbi:hypothetical protein HMPREF9136_0220 [Prevotella dentalis DSM 3688]|uniref:Uncharacterized protein n=1 Tax=Prevotella dentalis (strain ATCC 49559 / DSM 3688 / JCM 13448 / NCTC 12043 / ES 2772) TaxID=908937 RepID=F9D043_PREDD|nr:hypothetical protein HMPREF9136_0220 [Prevotella dentalis DSM 3688]